MVTEPAVVAAVRSAGVAWHKTEDPLFPIALALAQGLSATRGQGQAAVSHQLVDVVQRLRPVSGGAAGDAGQPDRVTHLSLLTQRKQRLDQAKRDA
jgi:hypothetical protein